MVQISIPKEFQRARKFVAIPVREYTAFLKTRRVRRSPTLDSAYRVFTKRPLSDVQDELTAAHSDDPQLVADVIAGLKRSSLYATRPTAAR